MKNMCYDDKILHTWESQRDENDFNISHMRTTTQKYIMDVFVCAE